MNKTAFNHSQLVRAAMTTKEGVSPSSVELFRRIMVGISILAFFTHLLFAAMFYFADIVQMAIFNMFSMGCYVLSYSLCQRRRMVLAWWTTIAEVLTHAVLATLYVGWNANFHLYALLILPVLLFGYQNPFAVKLPITLTVIIGYLGMDFVFSAATPWSLLDANYIALLHTVNLCVFLGFLAFLCALYNSIVVRSERKLSEYASTDPLTKLRNRRSMMACAEIEVSRHRRNQKSLSFIICDIDHFKRINDTVGHDGGDAVLKAVAAVLMAHTRISDTVCRWGGEEFLIMLPETPVDKAVVVAERIRAAVQLILDTDPIALPYKSQLDTVTMSFGLSEFKPGETFISYPEAVDAADRLLYKAKKTGRNRVCFD